MKDIGRFTIMAAESKFYGVYNGTGPSKTPLLWKDFLGNAKTQFNSQTKLIWASEDFLQENNVSPFSDLPLWVPLSEDAFMQISNEKLIQTGFEFTPINETLDDIMKWFRSNMEADIKFGTKQIGVGLDRRRELDLIAKLIPE